MPGHKLFHTSSTNAPPKHALIHRLALWTRRRATSLRVLCQRGDTRRRIPPVQIHTHRHKDIRLVYERVYHSRTCLAELLRRVPLAPISDTRTLDAAGDDTIVRITAWAKGSSPQARPGTVTQSRRRAQAIAQPNRTALIRQACRRS